MSTTSGCNCIYPYQACSVCNAQLSSPDHTIPKSNEVSKDCLINNTIGMLSTKEPDFIVVKNEGIKHDQEKPDLSLLPIEFLTEVSRAMMHGEKKYGRYNYTGGMAWHRIISAGLRHLYAFSNGEDLDAESGISHLGHAGACILMLTVYVKRNLGQDTREKK